MAHANLALMFNLKWNPFATEIPYRSLLVTARVDDFFWRIENHMLRHGGFGAHRGRARVRQERRHATARQTSRRSR